MRRYWRLWLSFLKASAMADAEYRMNISLRIIGELCWYMAQLSVFEVLFLHSPRISGWDVNAMRVFMGTLFMVDNTYMLLFSENMDHVNALVRKGDLDLYLVKPVSSQFMVTFRKVSVAHFANLSMIFVYLIWAVGRLPQTTSAWQVASYILLMVCGVASYYGMRFLFCTLSVILQDAGNVHFIWHNVFRLATRPDPIYPGFLRFLVLTFIPVGFMASVPSRIIVEGLDWALLAAAPAMALSLVYLSHLAWTAALKRYASASS